VKRTILTTIALFAVATWFAVLEHRHNELAAQQPTIEKIIEEGNETGLYEFPAGDFYTDKPIALPDRDGLTFRGAGNVYHRKRHKSERQTTRIIWTGPPDRSFFTGAVRDGLFEGVAFVDAVVHITSGRDIGTGHSLFNRCSFIGKDAGIKFGDQHNRNAADNTIRNCQFVQCEKPVELLASQVVNNLIDGCKFFKTKCVLYVKGGGLTKIRDAYCSQVPTIIHLDESCYQPRPPQQPIFTVASGNGLFEITGLCYDQGQAGVRPELVRDDSRRGPRRLVYSPVHWPPGGGDLTVSNGATWVIIPTLQNHLPTEGN